MRDILLPDEIRVALEKGATLAISISGGKDGQAMLNALVAAHKAHGWTGAIFAVHAHLGRMEWKQSLAHCQAIADKAGIDLIVVERPQGDLLQEIEDREVKLRGTGKVPFPDSQNRYCTADQKRSQIDKVLRAAPFPDAKNRYCTSHHKGQQIDKVLRNPFPTATQRYCTADQKRDQILKVHRGHELVVSAMGFRAAESPARAKRSVVSVQRRITAKALCDLTPQEALDQKKEGQRLALDWLPIFDWGIDDVWEACGASTEDLERRRTLYKLGWEDEAFDGWVAHPAYVMGNERVSCAICILGSRNDIINGAKHNPELLESLRAIEQRSGFTFRQDLSLTDLDPFAE